jgi:hypothetical protein
MSHGHMSIFRQAEDGFHNLWYNIIFFTGKEQTTALLISAPISPITL